MDHAQALRLTREIRLLSNYELTRVFIEVCDQMMDGDLIKSDDRVWEARRKAERYESDVELDEWPL